MEPQPAARQGCYLISCHLCLTSLARQRVHQYGVAWQLSRQWNSFPVCPTICGVQQNGRPAYNPALIPIEADRVETIIEPLILCSSNSSRVPGLPAVCGFQERLTCAQKKTCMLLIVNACLVAAQHHNKGDGSTILSGTMIGISSSKRYVQQYHSWVNWQSHLQKWILRSGLSTGWRMTEDVGHLLPFF